jgi:hypothetical protein
MNYQKMLPCTLVILLLCPLISANSASVYKCTKKDKSVTFTDKPCPADSQSQIVYTETEEQIQHRILDEKLTTIKKLIAGNQNNAAKEYAQKNNLLEFYNKELASYSSQKAEQETQNAEQEKQQRLQLQQESLTLQKRQLELQRQQMAIENSQPKEVIVNQPYYSYPVAPYPQQNCRWSNNSRNCLPAYPPSRVQPLSPGGLNPPPQSIMRPMNPPTSGGLNPPPQSVIQKPLPTASGRVILPKR